MANSVFEDYPAKARIYTTDTVGISDDILSRTQILVKQDLGSTMISISEIAAADIICWVTVLTEYPALARV